jgi:pyruvyltransferase
MYWWRFEQQSQRNFGDEISPLLVEEAFGRRCTWTWPHRCEIVAAGSIIELVREMKGSNRPFLWGTGFMRDEDDHLDDREFDVIAVRGTRSRDRVTNGRERVALGDPGLLADCLLASAPAKKYRLGILPHFLDATVEEVDWLRRQDGVLVIDATDEPRRVVQDIARCETLLSSSLHGLIVADSVGVPNAHIRLSGNRFIGGMYKFRDYYSVFTDPARYFEVSPGRVLGTGVAAAADQVQERYHPPADLARIKERLRASFPLA